MEKYNRLTVLEVVGHDKTHRKIVRCICDCGKEYVGDYYRIKTGGTGSCGCLRLGHKRTVKHGLMHSPIYRVWACMKQRCYYEKADNYCNYGGRGITVCGEWRNDPKCFYDWMVANGWRVGLQIDRIDNEKNYCPENCRLVTPKENAFNRRDTIRVEKDGKWYSLKNYCETFGLKYEPIIQRMCRLNWSIERALSTPIEKRTKRKKD
jgi:hypothetical protein